MIQAASVLAPGSNTTIMHRPHSAGIASSIHHPHQHPHQPSNQAPNLAVEIFVMESQLQQHHQSSTCAGGSNNSLSSSQHSQMTQQTTLSAASTIVTSGASSSGNINKQKRLVRKTELVPRKKMMPDDDATGVPQKQMVRRQTPPTAPCTPSGSVASSKHQPNPSALNATYKSSNASTSNRSITLDVDAAAAAWRQRQKLEQEIREMEAAIQKQQEEKMKKSQQQYSTTQQAQSQQPQPQQPQQQIKPHQQNAQQHPSQSRQTSSQASDQAAADRRRQQLEAEIAAMEAAIAAQKKQKRPIAASANGAGRGTAVAVDTTTTQSKSSGGRPGPGLGLSLMDSIAKAAGQRDERLGQSAPVVTAVSSPASVSAPPSLMNSIAQAAAHREQRVQATGGVPVAVNPPAVAPAVSERPHFLSGIAAAAASRDDRVQKGEMIKQDIKPEVAEPRRTAPQLSFDMAEMITKKAREREKRLEAGGEKKMTAIIQTKDDHMRVFKNVFVEAAELGRLTRLNEVVVEATAREKTREQEWRSNGLLAINWRSNHMSVIHQAAAAGASRKLPERVVSNWESEQQEGANLDDEETANVLSPRMMQLLAVNKNAGDGQHKVDHFIMGRKEEHRSSTTAADSLLVKPMVCYTNIEDVHLPRKAPPKFSAAKARERMANAIKEAQANHRPMVDISNEVATRAWERRARLDRPNVLPRIKDGCRCPYCENPSPYQTFAYKAKEQRRKHDGYESPEEDNGPTNAAEHRRQRERERRERIERAQREQQQQHSGVEQESVGMATARSKFGLSKAELDRQRMLELEKQQLELERQIQEQKRQIELKKQKQQQHLEEQQQQESTRVVLSNVPAALASANQRYDEYDMDADNNYSNDGGGTYDDDNRSTFSAISADESLVSSASRQRTGRIKRKVRKVRRKRPEAQEHQQQQESPQVVLSNIPASISSSENRGANHIEYDLDDADPIRVVEGNGDDNCSTYSGSVMSLEESLASLPGKPKRKPRKVRSNRRVAGEQLQPPSQNSSGSTSQQLKHMPSPVEPGTSNVVHPEQSPKQTRLVRKVRRVPSNRNNKEATAPAKTPPQPIRVPEQEPNPKKAIVESAPKVVAKAEPPNTTGTSAATTEKKKFRLFGGLFRGKK